MVPSVAISLIILLYLPTLIWLVRSWLHNPYYSYGFLIPLVSAIIVWSRREALRKVEHWRAGVLVLALGIAAYLMGFAWGIRSLSALSLIIVLAGLVLELYGIKAARAMAFPISFLIFMIPIPYIDQVAFDLQDISVHASGWLLRVLGLPVAVSGVAISLDDMTFTVGIPCSGMNTLMALVAFAAVYVYLLVGSPLKRLAVFLCSVPIAILANIFRVSSIILVAHSYSEDFALGFYHDISNLLVFLLGFLLIALIGKILGLRFAPRI